MRSNRAINVCPLCKGYKSDVARECVTCRWQKPLPDKLWAKVTPGAENVCWPIPTRKEYGQLRYRRRTVIATHVALATRGVRIPAGMYACHTCDNPPCVNPAHLFIGTNTDNQRDASRKGRSVDHRGEKHPLALLTDAAVLAIRAQRAVSPKDLAVRYGVAERTIHNVLSRRAWRHVTSCDWSEECEASVVGSVGDGNYCRRHMAQLQAQFGVALA